MNTVILTGNICADPELRYLPSGSAVCNFNVANNRKWTQNGEKKEEVSFIGVVSFGKQAETVAQYFKKGSPILVQGRLKQESWEKDGKKQSKTVVVLEGFEFMSRGEGRAQPASNRNTSDVPLPKARPNVETTPAIDKMDNDSVPF